MPLWQRQKIQTLLRQNRMSVDRPRGGRIVSGAFLPHECMGAVEFVPPKFVPAKVAESLLAFYYS
jgi:hypothetical protein